jgi:signal transduction histidine kinase
MPLEYTNKIFELFESTSGSGIGLALVESIVEAHEAKIYQPDSKQGEDSFTEFVIQFGV